MGIYSNGNICHLSITEGCPLLNNPYDLIEMRVHKHKRRVNCAVKFRKIRENKLRPCSNRLFVTRPEAKIQRNEVEEIVDTGFLRENTSRL